MKNKTPHLKNALGNQWKLVPSKKIHCSVMYYLGLLAAVPAVCITCKYHFPLLLKGHSRHSISSICYFEGRATDGRIC